MTQSPYFAVLLEEFVAVFAGPGGRYFRTTPERRFDEPATISANMNITCHPSYEFGGGTAIGLMNLVAVAICQMATLSANPIIPNENFLTRSTVTLHRRRITNRRDP
jgi:hypothetical protein